MSLRETYQSRKNLLAANLTRQGVSASGDEGLTTLINKVLDISHTSTPTTLKTYINGVEVDNTQELPATIISYADGEYVDYKFVVLDENNNPVQRYSIPLSVGGVEVSPTPVTDGNGEVNYRYVSGGVGDTNIYINCTLLTKTFAVEDCNKYWGTIQAGSEIAVDYSLPSSFKLEFTIFSSAPTTAPSVSLLRFNASNGIWLGKGSSGSANITLFGTAFGSISANTEYNYVLTYEGSVASLTDGTTTKTSTQSLTKLYSLASTSNSILKEIKVKPL